MTIFYFLGQRPHVPTNTPPVTVEEWSAEVRKDKGKVLPVRRFVGDVAGEAGADGLVPIIMSTSSEDRAGDTVSDDGWVLTDYLRNPVLLWCHDQSLPAIGNVENVSTGPLRGVMRFTPREVNPFGDMIGAMYRHKFMRAGSVGFMPLEWDFHDHGVRFKRQALLEHSCCNVPMNADALAAAKSLGVEVDLFLPFAEKTLDRATDAPFWMPPQQAFAIYRSMTGPRVQVPAAMPEAPRTDDALAAEVRRLGAIVEGFGKTLASLKAPPVSKAAPAVVPDTPKAKLGPNAATLKAIEATVSKRVAALTGAVVDE